MFYLNGVFFQWIVNIYKVHVLLYQFYLQVFILPINKQFKNIYILIKKKKNALKKIKYDLCRDSPHLTNAQKSI